MTLMVNSSRRKLLAVFITLLVVFETAAFAAMMPTPSEPFIQIYLLGSNHLAGNYYPNNDSNIPVGAAVVWYLGVTNNMGTVQLISIRVKIANETIEAPDPQRGIGSQGPLIIDFDRALLNNETWAIPFAWSISNATLSGASVRVLTLHIDNDTYELPDWTATHGYNFRFIFEVWIWQTETNTFEFGWQTEGGHRAAWLQVWFNMTNPNPPSGIH